MPPIRTITLDLDDTLWPIAPVIARAEQTLWHWLATHYPRITTRWNDAAIAELRQAVASEHAARAHDLRFIRRTVLARMAAAAGYGDELVDPAFAVFDEQRNTVDLYPDVRPALERLARDYRIVALTNGNACLERIGIRELFHGVVTATAAGAAKPDVQIFDAACAIAGVTPAEVLHVGDHPELDVAGARAAGMRTAWVNRGGQRWPDGLAPPDAAVATLDELVAWLDAGRQAGPVDAA